MFIKSLIGIANAFASTLPKPRKPTLHPKLCQRACKAYGCSVDTLIPIYELNGGVQSGIKEGMVLYSQKKKEIDVIVNQIDEDKAIAEGEDIFHENTKFKIGTILSTKKE